MSDCICSPGDHPKKVLGHVPACPVFRRKVKNRDDRAKKNDTQKEITDMVNKPPHYQIRPGYEVYDLRQDLAKKVIGSGASYDEYSDWDRALEYLLRMWEKNGVEDAEKAQWYIDKLIMKLKLK